MTEDNAIIANATIPAPLPPDLFGEPSEGIGKGKKRGRKRVDDPRDKVLRIRCTGTELRQLDDRAKAAGLSVGAYLRAAGLGQGGPRAMKRPRVETELLARVLGEIGRMHSGHNQIAKWTNTMKEPASAAEIATIRADVAAIRAAIMGALGRGD